jgi:hypothetical protein
MARFAQRGGAHTTRDRRSDGHRRDHEVRANTLNGPVLAGDDAAGASCASYATSSTAE